MAKAKNKTRFNFGYGAIYQRKTKKGKIRWYLDFWDADGKRIQKVAPNVTSKEEAALALKQEVQKSFDAEYGITRKQLNIKLREFIDLYIENYSKPNKRSWKDDRYRLMRSAEILGSDSFLSKVSSLDIDKLKKHKLQEGVTQSTVNTYIRVLKRMFNVAIQWGYAQSNPVSKIRMYSEAEARRSRVLTLEEEDRLMHVVSNLLRPIVIIALNTGMRKGEIMQLKWDDLDLEGRTINVRKTKSGKPRTIPINSRLLVELQTLRSTNGNSTSLFTNPKTGQAYKTIRKHFETAREEAQLRNFTFHDFRRTFGSRLALAGVDLNRIKELLGHASIKTTEIYLHADSKDIQDAVEVLCQKKPKKVEKQGRLLHICDMEDDEQEARPAIPLFTVN